MRCVWLFSLIILLLSASGCHRAQDKEMPRSIYYWKTTLKLSPKEREALQQLGIKRVYLHVFDVVRDSHGRLRPLSTLDFIDTIPDGIDIVPVAFINEDALHSPAGIDSIGAKIVRRAVTMLEVNGYSSPIEIQLDYDWNNSTRDTYFKILREAREEAHSRGIKISSTIRLHQLKESPPPADAGALMVYNTGNFRNPQEVNSIYSINHLKPYLQYLMDYDLPLSLAMPIYNWNLVFRRGNFQMIGRNIDLSDTLLARRIDSIHWQCLEYRGVASSNHKGRLYPGDIIRHEAVSFEDLQELQKAVAGQRPDAAKNVILYHLDETTIKPYKINELETLYHRP